MKFKGFTNSTIPFLKDLKLNNNKDWFEQNRSTYEEHLLKPLKFLATDLEPVIKSIDTKIETAPSINKTISRIYRDTRFSHDKSPYRTDAWVSFKRPAKVWGNVPEFFMFFTTEEYQIGVGFYAATPANMEKFRQHIFLYPERFQEIVDHYNSQDTYILQGEDYKKSFPNQLPASFQPWIQKKNLYISRAKKINDLFVSEQLEAEMEKAFVFNADFYHFFIEALDLD
jgi:uncharacterized protein (TIGR02453 family)